MIEQVKGTQNISNDDSLKYLYIQSLFLNKFGDYGYKYMVEYLFISLCLLLQYLYLLV